MNLDKKSAIIIGVLYLTALFTAMIGSEGFIAPIINLPDYLINVYPNKAQVIIGILLELICALAVIGIAVMLFPILRRSSENLARGYFGLRIIESAMIFVSAVSLLSLITLGKEYVKKGVSDVSNFQALGSLAVAGHYWAFQMVIIVCGIAGLMFCYLLYKSRLVPRFLSILGVIGYPLTLVASLIDIFGHSPEMIFFIPGALFEIVFPIWIMVKGFNSSVVAHQVY